MKKQKNNIHNRTKTEWIEYIKDILIAKQTKPRPQVELPSFVSSL